MLRARRALRSMLLPVLLSPVAAGAQTESAPPRESSPMASASIDALAGAKRRLVSNDSAGAIALLQRAAAADPDNAALWWEYGSLLAARTRFAWRREVMPAGVPQAMIAADTAMSRAVRLAPDSLHYAVAYGRFLFGTNIFSVSRAEGMQKGAITRLAGTTDTRRDSVMLGESADYVGWMQWRRFEPLINMSTPVSPDSRDRRMMASRDLVAYVRETHRPPKTMYGLALFNDAREYFRLARRVDPAVEQYFRHEMLMLAEARQWPEMEMEARARIAHYRDQPWGWLTLGLARHRQGAMAEGQAAFDSGLVRLPAADRQRLQSIVKLLPVARRAWYDSLDADERQALETVFWNTANPSLLLPSNQALGEFRARVVYAELRFTDEEMRRFGTDTEKGRVYIQYGPPDVVTPFALMSGTPASPDLPRPQSWVYFHEVLVFTFGQMPGHGTAFGGVGSYLGREESSALDRGQTWTNLPVLRRRVDSVNAQVARFRAPGDSMDLAIFAGTRNGAIRRGAPMDESRILYGAFVLDVLGSPIRQRTDTVRSRERDTVTVTPRDYFLRAPASASAVRLEALEPDLLQAARSITDVGGFATFGFGISDLLVTARATPRVDEPARWTDFRFTPLVGTTAQRGAPIDLLWETYDAGAAGGRSRLRVAIAVQRETGTGLLAVAGKIVGGVRDAVTRSSTVDRTTITYDREYQPASVLVDHLRVDLGRLVPGRYRVSLTVTDLVRGSSVSRIERFAIDR